MIMSVHTIAVKLLSITQYGFLYLWWIWWLLLCTYMNPSCQSAGLHLFSRPKSKCWLAHVLLMPRWW
jgi:hypothetical protein